MFRLILSFIFLLAISFPLPNRAEAQAAAVVGGIVGTKAASEIFADLREDLEGVISQAEAAGNRLIQNLADTALDLLDAVEASAGSLINQTFDRLDDSTRAAANEVNEVLNRIEENQAVLIGEADRMSANMVSAMRGLPLVADLNEVYNFSPRVVSPIGSDIVRIKVLGPGIGGAEAVATLEGKNLNIQMITTSEIQIIVPRDSLVFDPGNSNFAEIKLTFDEDDGGILTSPRRVERELYLWLLPTHLADWTLSQTVERSTQERKYIRTFVTAAGRDAAGGGWMNVRADDYENGWRLDVIELGRMMNDCANDATKCNYHGFMEGRAMSCVGPDLSQVNERRVYYRMQFGHFMEVFHRRGGSGRCVLNLPLKRSTTSNAALESDGHVTWAEDQILELDENVTKWELALELYDNRVVRIDSQSSVPSMDVAIEKSRDRVLLRPVRPHDF